MGNKLITPETKDIKKHFMKVIDPVSVKGWTVISDSIEATGGDKVFLETCDGDAWLNHFQICLFTLGGKVQILASPDFGDLYDVDEIEDIVRDSCLLGNSDIDINTEILEEMMNKKWADWSGPLKGKDPNFYYPYITNTYTTNTYTTITC